MSDFRDDMLLTEAEQARLQAAYKFGAEPRDTPEPEVSRRVSLFAERARRVLANSASAPKHFQRVA